MAVNIMIMAMMFLIGITFALAGWRTRSIGKGCMVMIMAVVSGLMAFACICWVFVFSA